MTYCDDNERKVIKRKYRILYSDSNDIWVEKTTRNRAMQRQSVFYTSFVLKLIETRTTKTTKNYHQVVKTLIRQFVKCFLEYKLQDFESHDFINKFHSFCWDFVLFHVNHYHWLFECSLFSFVHVFCAWKEQSNDAIFTVENDIENDEFCDWFERRFSTKNIMNFSRAIETSIYCYTIVWIASYFCMQRHRRNQIVDKAFDTNDFVIDDQSSTVSRRTKLRKFQNEHDAHNQ